MIWLAASSGQGAYVPGEVRQPFIDERGRFGDVVDAPENVEIRSYDEDRQIVRCKELHVSPIDTSPGISMTCVVARQLNDLFTLRLSS